MSASQPLAILRRTWWIPTLALAASLGAAFGLTWSQAPTYRGSATVVVVPNIRIVESVRDRLDSLDTLDRRSVVATLARIARSRVVLDDATEASGLTPEDARACRIRTIVLPNTNIIEIEVDGPKADHCASLANALCQAASSQAIDIYQVFRLRTLDDAIPNWRPVAPDLRQNLTVAGVLGLLAGLFVAVAVDFLRRPPPAA